MPKPTELFDFDALRGSGEPEPSLVLVRKKSSAKDSGSTSRRRSGSSSRHLGYEYYAEHSRRSQRSGRSSTSGGTSRGREVDDHQQAGARYTPRHAPPFHDRCHNTSRAWSSSSCRGQLPARSARRDVDSQLDYLGPFENTGTVYGYPPSEVDELGTQLSHITIFSQESLSESMIVGFDPAPPYSNPPSYVSRASSNSGGGGGHDSPQSNSQIPSSPPPSYVSDVRSRNPPFNGANNEDNNDDDEDDDDDDDTSTIVPSDSASMAGGSSRSGRPSPGGGSYTASISSNSSVHSKTSDQAIAGAPSQGSYYSDDNHYLAEARVPGPSHFKYPSWGHGDSSSSFPSQGTGFLRRLHAPNGIQFASIQPVSYSPHGMQKYQSPGSMYGQYGHGEQGYGYDDEE